MLILGDELFITTIIDGLKQDVSYVRQKFIKFVEMFVPYLKKFTKDHPAFVKHYDGHVDKLLDVFCKLLRKVDVRFFSSSKKNTQ